MRARRLKRAFDLLVAVPILVISMPVQAAVAVLVRSKLGSPVLFRQERPGKDGRPFTLVKFRTMLEVNPEMGLVDDANRMTDLGRLLRASSLDELPTLWNVVRGDMSIVGPRPLLMSYLPLYSVAELRRHEARPGITGLAQVSGRNALAWDDRLRLDVEYVEAQSLWLDLCIIGRTIRSVIGRQGISAPDHVTMPPLERPLRDRSKP